MKRIFFTALFVILVGSLAAQAQGNGQFAGVCHDVHGNPVQCATGPAPAAPPAVNPALYNGFYQLGYNFGRWLFGGGGSNAADEALREQQQQMMMAELRRREEEAERLHQEQEAERLAAMYNRLAGTLKLSGLPHLQLKTSGIPAGGLQLKMGDNAQGYGIPGLPGIYTGGPAPSSAQPPTGSGLRLKMGDGAAGTGQAADNGQQGYGIPGLPGIYTGGPGPGSALPLPSQAGLQLKMGDSTAAATQAPAASASSATDFSKMTPQQLADAADAFSKLPPEEQQRAMAAGQNGSAQPQQTQAPQANGATAERINDVPASQPGPAPTAPAASASAPPQLPSSLQQQANASQAAAAATVPEDASARARVGFDTTSVPGPVQLGAAKTPEAIPPSQPLPTYPSVPPAPASSALVQAPYTAGPDTTPHKVDNSIIQYLFPANQPSSVFPKVPDPPLNNPLREYQRLQDDLKAWDDWAVQQATHFHDSHTVPGEIAYPQGTVQSMLNRSAVQQYAPELVDRYNSDAAFRQSVDQRLESTDEHVALDYYEGLAEAHKAAILEFQADLNKLVAAGSLDKLTPLEDQYRLHPERRPIVEAAWNRASADEQAALSKAQAAGGAAVDKEYQFAFQLIRGGAAQQ